MAEVNAPASATTRIADNGQGTFPLIRQGWCAGRLLKAGVRKVEVTAPASVATGISNNG